MMSDWIRALFDKEVLYLKLIAFADGLEPSVARKYQAACKGVSFIGAWAKRLFWVAFIATLAAPILWIVSQQFTLRWESGILVLVGFSWAAFLTWVTLFLGALQGLASNFKELARFLSEVQEGVLRALRIPAWVALTTLFLVIIVGRFPSLRQPSAMLSLLGIGAVVGLACFLGLLNLSAAWLRRLIASQLVLALVLLLVAPQFPHVSAWLRRQSTRVKQGIGANAAAKQVTVDPKNPPALFDPITGEALYYYSGDTNSGFILWDGPGFDPDTGQPLLKLEGKSNGDLILGKLRVPRPRAESPRSEVIREPRRLHASSSEDVRFVDYRGSNTVWYYKDPEGAYELYDAPGYHRTGGRLQAADTQQDREEILKWLKEKAHTPQKDPQRQSFPLSSAPQNSGLLAQPSPLNPPSVATPQSTGSETFTAGVAIEKKPEALALAIRTARAGVYKCPACQSSRGILARGLPSGSVVACPKCREKFRIP